MTGQLKIAFNSGLGVSETGGNGDRLRITSTASGAVFVQNDTSAIIFQTDSGTERGRFRNTAAGGGFQTPLLFVNNNTTDANATAGLGADIDAPWIRIGDATTDRTYTNGQGIKFHDSSTQHYSIGQLGGKFLIAQTGTNGNALYPNTTSTVGILMDNNSRVGINIAQSTSLTYQLQVSGSFAATTKSFRIPHPTKENHDLVYGSLEGPEHGVYVRGKSSDVIELPDYWVALVDENTITVQLTPIGNHMSWVEKIEDNKILIGGGEAFYFVQAMRKDIEKLEVEVELPIEEEE